MNLPQNPDSKELQIAGQLLQKDFGEFGKEIAVHENLEEMIEAIIRVIRPLLNYQMDKLLNIFYRLDLNETKVKEVLSISDPETMERNLAILILKREMEKAKWRAKYSS